MANKQALTFNRSLEVTYCRVVILFPWSRISTLRPTPPQLSIPDLVNLSLCSNFIFRLRMGMRQRVSFLKSDCTLCTGPGVAGGKDLKAKTVVHIPQPISQ